MNKYYNTSNNCWLNITNITNKNKANSIQPPATVVVVAVTVVAIRKVGQEALVVHRHRHRLRVVRTGVGFLLFFLNGSGAPSGEAKAMHCQKENNNSVIYSVKSLSGHLRDRRP